VAEIAVPNHDVDVDVSVEAKLIFIEPGCRWAHSLSSSRAPGISLPGYYENFREDVKNLRRSLTVIWGISLGCRKGLPQILVLTAP